jgi:TolA-binding protein
MKSFVLLLSVTLIQSALAATPQKLSQFPEGDRMVYGRLVDAYRKGNLIEVIHQRDLMAKYFNSSVYMDRAYYMTGLLQFQHNRYGEALRDLDIVTDKYLLSIKRPSAFFAMAMTYKKLNLNHQSQLILKKVIKEYPSSPEARRAAMQLRLETKI